MDSKELHEIIDIAISKAAARSKRGKKQELAIHQRFIDALLEEAKAKPRKVGEFTAEPAFTESEKDDFLEPLTSNRRVIPSSFATEAERDEYKAALTKDLLKFDALIAAKGHEIIALSKLANKLGECRDFVRRIQDLADSTPIRH